MLGDDTALQLAQWAGKGANGKPPATVGAPRGVQGLGNPAMAEALSPTLSTKRNDAGAQPVAGKKSSSWGRTLAAAGLDAAGTYVKAAGIIGGAAEVPGMIGRAIGEAIGGPSPMKSPTIGQASYDIGEGLSALASRVRNGGGMPPMSVKDQGAFNQANQHFHDSHLTGQQQPADPADKSNGNHNRGTQNENNLKAIIAKKQAQANLADDGTQ
jgi:hypothetical protein